MFIISNKLMNIAGRSMQPPRNLREDLKIDMDTLSVVQVIKEGYAQAVKDKGAYEDINRRAIQAERMRDELLVKVDNLTSSLRREEMK